MKEQPELCGNFLGEGTNMKIKLIVAVDKKFAIGKSGSLLFKIPEDLRLFKQLTTGNIVLMGRKTFESIGYKPLPDRINIVISSTKKYEIEGVINLDNLETAVECSKRKFPDKDLYIIGGGQIYEQGIKYADEVILTKYNKLYEDADTYFPVDIMDNFSETEVIMEGSYEGIEFKTFVLKII